MLRRIKNLVFNNKHFNNCIQFFKLKNNYAVPNKN